MKLPTIIGRTRPLLHDAGVSPADHRRRTPTLALPRSAATALRAAREVERAARGAQKEHARRATGRLVVAYLNAGWTVRAVADAIGLSSRTIIERQRRARAEPQPPLGITVEPPPSPPAPPRLDELAWLRPRQAALLMGVHVNQLWVWRRAGLLPSTRTTLHGAHSYARADLLGVLKLRAGRKILPPGTAVRHDDLEPVRGMVAAVPRKLIRGRRERVARGRSPARSN